MGSSRRVWLKLMLFLALSNTVVWGIPFNITNILAPYPDFNTFNNLLSRTEVAALINSRQTITVLAVDDAGMAPIMHQPIENIARILMVHVLLDYLSIPKLRDLREETAVTDLLQTTGVAEGHQGFVVVNRSSTGVIMFRAAGQKVESTHLVEEVFKLPYNISVLRVTQLIIAPGMITRDQPYAPTPALAPSPARAPTPAHSQAPTPRPDHASTPAPAADESSPPPEPDAVLPGDSDDAGAPAPAPVAVSAVSKNNVGCLVAAVAVGCLVNLMIIGC